MKPTSWVEIDLDAIAHNLRAVRQVIGDTVQIFAVVKADAYGHGARAAALTALAGGAYGLAVSTVSEGAELRPRLRRFGTPPILVMGPLLSGDVDDVLEHELTPSLWGLDEAQALEDRARRRGQMVAAHVFVDTGMGTMGLPHHLVLRLFQQARDFEHTVLEGLYSHFATAFAPNSPFAKQQLALFLRILDELREAGFQPPLCHMANSAAALLMPEARLDAVRLGNVLYGEHPSGATRTMVRLRNPWAWKTTVVSIRNVPAGGSLGYGRDFVAARPVRAAILPVGLADGFMVTAVRPMSTWRHLGRALALDVLRFFGHAPAAGQILIGGQPVPVLGRVAMQTCAVDVSGRPDVHPGTEAQLRARRASVAPWVPRLYTGNMARYLALDGPGPAGAPAPVRVRRLAARRQVPPRMARRWRAPKA